MKMWFSQKRLQALDSFVFLTYHTSPLPTCTYKTHTHAPLVCFDLCSERGVCIQSMTERALPPGSIHRSRMGRAEKEILTDSKGDTFRWRIWKDGAAGVCLRRYILYKTWIKECTKVEEEAIEWNSLKGESESVVMEISEWGVTLPLLDWQDTVCTKDTCRNRR